MFGVRKLTESRVFNIIVQVESPRTGEYPNTVFSANLGWCKPGNMVLGKITWEAGVERGVLFVLF